MPIGPYPTFDACVKANQDKRNPGGFCADLERKIKNMAEEQEQNTHIVKGVEIFAAGTWTDSQGMEREWTDSDLDKLLKNFTDDDKLPVKVGHTDDNFNSRVADELGIPGTLLTGDEGNGAARLGHIVNVRKDGSTLVADFDNVPNVLTEMIESGFYNAVSVEIDMPDEDDPHLSGVAILGAELPAVGVLASLDTATIFSNAKKPWVTLSFQEGEPIQISPEELAIEFADISSKMEELISGKRGARMLRAFWSEIRRKMSDITGNKFAASNWDVIIEQQRKDSNIKMPLELVAQLCPDCAGEMGKRGMTALKIQNFELPDTLKSSLMSAIGEPDTNFFAKCMSYDVGVKGGEKLGFCAWLNKEYTGKWPNLEDGGDLPSQEPSAKESTEEEFDVQEENNMGNFVLAPEDLPRLYEALGLPDTATIEDIEAAILALKGEEAPPAEEAPIGMPMSEETPSEDPRIAALEGELKELRGFTKTLQHEKLITHYAEQAKGWITMSGTAQERGAALAKIHVNSGEEAAKELASHYQMAHEAAMDAGVLKTVGSTTHDNAVQDDFHDTVEDYAKTNGVTFEKALAAMAVMPQYRGEFAAYSKRVSASVLGGK